MPFALFLILSGAKPSRRTHNATAAPLIDRRAMDQRMNHQVAKTPRNSHPEISLVALWRCGSPFLFQARTDGANNCRSRALLRELLAQRPRLIGQLLASPRRNRRRRIGGRPRRRGA